jgi:hypothetical protein
MAAYRYWEHFLALESDFAETSRYVWFAPDNFGTYSIEYAKLLLAIGSEVDVICKVICENIDAAAPRRNIDDYRACLVAHTMIATEEILIRRYDLSFRPWDQWSAATNPAWWRCYNNVKHERDAHFREANLGNCANAIAGLFAAVLYCYKAENSGDVLQPYPLLLGREREPAHFLLEDGYTVPDFT